MGHLGAAHRFDDRQVADHDEPVGGPGQANVQPLPAAVTGAVLVDAQHHRAAFQTFEPQHVAVEDVLVRPDVVPVLGEPARLLTFDLNGGGVGPW